MYDRLVYPLVLTWLSMILRYELVRFYQNWRELNARPRARYMALESEPLSLD